MAVSTAGSALSVDIYSILRLWSACNPRQHGDGLILEAGALGASDTALCEYSGSAVNGCLNSMSLWDIFGRWVWSAESGSGSALLLRKHAGEILKELDRGGRAAFLLGDLDDVVQDRGNLAQLGDTPCRENVEEGRERNRDRLVMLL